MNIEMDETQKPFACTVEGCQMTFTNEDHLNWHGKKHDMILNLGLAKNNEVADQTPTPTRFIRNCEEVGLFQDLQNVNPFDEFFKKAVEQVKSGGTLEVQETNSDDTLHTPHILPHIEVQEKVPEASKTSRNSILNVKTNSYNNDTIDPAVTNAASNTIRQKIKEVLLNKEKKDGTTLVRNVKKQLTLSTTDARNKVSGNQNSINSIQGETREKIREMNRAAQMRCRKRKQMKLAQMEEELEFLREQNRRLYKENGQLWLRIEQLQQKNSNEVANPEETSQPDQGKTTSTSNPIVIKVIPPLHTITVPVIPSLTPGFVKIQQTTISEKRKTKKKKLRKLIPRVKIEN